MKPASGNPGRAAGTLAAEFAPKRKAIRKRLKEFAAVPSSEYFYEMVYCLLTPQSSAVNAGKAVLSLRAAGFPEHEIDASLILGSREHYIRFHNTKARRLTAARQQWDAISAVLDRGLDPPDERLWLVQNVKGLGWKESSHFLRNIGRKNLAILDRHILRNLTRHRVLRAFPRTLTPRQYAKIEQQFLSFAAQLGITIDELDLLFWSRETGEILK